MAGKLFKKRIVNEEHTPFKELPFSEKIHYIWEYYKIYFIAFILIAIAVASFVNAFIRNNYNTACSIAVVDGKMTGYDDNSDMITTELQNYLGLDGKKDRVICDYYYSLIEQDMDQEASVTRSKIYTLASTHSLDGYLSNRDYIDYFSSDQEPFLLDLREVLSNQELEKIGDALIYYTMDDGTTFPFAVDLTNTKIKTDSDFTMVNPCYGVLVTAPNEANAVSFIKYAFNL